MFDECTGDDLFSASDALEAIAELERNTNDAILAQRSSERLEIRAKVTVQPANASERHRSSIEVVTADISNGGCMVLSPQPIMPGDVFWITFNPNSIQLGSLFARALRCRLVREDIFEVGFRFLNDISLADVMTN